MRIAFIGQKGMPSQNGGVETYVNNLAINLASLGQEVLVYNRYDYLPQPLKEFKDIKIINKFYVKGKNLAGISHAFFACLDVIFRPVDIIHFQGIGPSLLLWLPKLLKPRVKIIATLHSFDYYNDKWSRPAKMMLRLGERQMCRYADEIIVLTPSMQNYIKEKYGRETNLIPNGVNLCEEKGNDSLLAWGLTGDNYILSVSRIIKLKGLQYLIAAFKNLKTDKKLVITGVGEYLKELKKMAESDKRIIFTGNQTGRILNQLYANAYLFVQSSEMEGLSTSLLEAMAHKTPCLVSDIEANLNALGDTGFSFISKNIDDLQNKLQYLLDNQGELEAKRQESFNRVRYNFSWPIITQKVLEVYHKLIN